MHWQLRYLTYLFLITYGRMKTHLRPSLQNNRLMHMKILHVHKDKLLSRTPIFGKFITRDRMKKAELHHIVLKKIRIVAFQKLAKSFHSIFFIVGLFLVPIFSKNQ